MSQVVRSILPVIFFLFLISAIFFSPGTTNCHAAEPAIAATDSSLVAAFLELPKAVRDEHRNQADELAKQAAKTDNGPARRTLLRDAVAVDPAGTGHWLALAEVDRVMGYTREAAANLAAARVALDFVRGKERRDTIRDYALAKAWWCYEMAQWQEGVEWGRQAVKYDAGQSGHLVNTLNNTRFLKSLDDGMEYRTVFLPLNSGGNRRANLSWCNLMLQHFLNLPFEGMEMAHWLKRSTHHDDHDTMRWRDFGMRCEVTDVAKLAVSYYENSARALPVQEGGWLKRLERKIPTMTKGIGLMPFWVNTEGDYVTGSLLAYAGHAHDSLLAATDDSVRIAWAEKLAAICARTIERYQRRPWPAIWRSRALLVLDRIEEAEDAIIYAREAFRLLEFDEPALNPLQGHLLLMKDNFSKAAPMLRQGVNDFPDDAVCWADLGLIEIMEGGRAAARRAFDRALALDDRLVVAWYNRGLLNLQDGLMPEALADIERAAELVPQNERIATDLARVRGLASRQEATTQTRKKP